MKPLCGSAALLLGLAIAMPAFTDDKKPPKKYDGFVPLFNGKNMTGWVNVNCSPGTFFVRDKEIITTGKPTGYLRTAKQYENFIADFEWMHVPPNPGAVGNSGFFVWADPIPAVGTGYTRGIEVQVLVNLEYKDKKTGEVTASSHGDLFSIWGAKCVPDRPHPLGWARCIPSENRCKGANEWNHYRVEARDGVIKLAVNGKVVSGVSQCSPRKGYLALESEGSECHFRNLKVKELPSTNPKPSEIADEAKGHKNLYTGLDLSGWKVDEKAKRSWQPQDTVLHYDGKGEARNAELRTEKEYGDAEFIVDFRFPSKDRKPCVFILRDGRDEGIKLSFAAGGSFSLSILGDDLLSEVAPLKPVGQWNRLRVSLKEGLKQLTLNDKILSEGRSAAMPKKGAFVLRPEGEMDFANLLVRELDEKE